MNGQDRQGKRIMDRKLNINVTIEGIQLPLTVANTEEEKVYRDASSLIQNRLKVLRDTYPTLPNDKYYYAMAMLNTAVDAVRASMRTDSAPFMEAIKDLEAEMDGILR
ncbi:MAG: cell division protein ZapA [Prevotellaceae bacterium]|nr:cell division protein ZapA [Prevotellaceae bacterium]